MMLRLDKQKEEAVQFPEVPAINMPTTRPQPTPAGGRGEENEAFEMPEDECETRVNGRGLLLSLSKHCCCKILMTTI